MCFRHIREIFLYKVFAAFSVWRSMSMWHILNNWERERKKNLFQLFDSVKKMHSMSKQNAIFRHPMKHRKIDFTKLLTNASQSCRFSFVELKKKIKAKNSENFSKQNFAWKLFEQSCGRGLDINSVTDNRVAKHKPKHKIN